ncbi:hypothetical protein LN042_35475 [Kitasatospora sp. RB6PN24]|uniref:hypothetical protein n=1 Tax=Kitasatospora humi TaxID=2893891 RepID=UPI001E32F3E6|nr:hypothetical protein [Kitasatospora humi]MCC9312304.1 hypothetical protein [Kitasatospora humi]
MTHRESAPAAERPPGEGLTQTLPHGRHSRPKPLGGQLRLPAIKVSGAAMAMSTVVGISIATTWLISAQQRVGYGPGMSTVGATPAGGGAPDAPTPAAQLAGGAAPAVGSASSTAPLSSGATVTDRNGRDVKPGPTQPAGRAPAGPTTAGGASTPAAATPSGQPTDRAAVTAPSNGGVTAWPAAGPSTPAPGASSAAEPAASPSASPPQSAGQARPTYPSGITPGTSATAPGMMPGVTPGTAGGPGHAIGFHPGSDEPGSPTATTPTPPAPTATTPTPPAPSAPTAPDTPSASAPTAPATPAAPAPRTEPGTSPDGTPAAPGSPAPGSPAPGSPAQAPSLAGWGGTVASAGLGQRYTVTLTVTEPLAAVETELRLPRTDATAGAMVWSTLPGARVTLLQRGDTVVYRFAPPPGEDVLPGTYTFTVQGARSATPGIGDATGRWTASGFALRFPQAVAAHGGFTAAKP